MHLDGQAQPAIRKPLSGHPGRPVRTIADLAQGERLHPVQQAWIELDVAQCGYCQTGQIMAAVDLLARTPQPSEDDIRAIGNLCRCGTYPRIRQAIVRAAQLIAKEGA